MERFALSNISEGVLCIEEKDGLLQLIYYNQAAIQILGEFSEDNWLESFLQAEKFIQLSKKCLETKRKNFEFIEIRNDEQLVYTSFTSFEGNKLIVVLQPLYQYTNCQPLYDGFYDLHCTILEYHQLEEVQYSFLFGLTLQDLQYLAVSKKCQISMNRKTRDVLGKFAAKENIMCREVVQHLIQNITGLKTRFQRQYVELKLGPPTFVTTKEFCANIVLLENCGNPSIKFLIEY